MEVETSNGKMTLISYECCHQCDGQATKDDPDGDVCESLCEALQNAELPKCGTGGKGWALSANLIGRARE